MRAEEGEACRQLSEERQSAQICSLGDARRSGTEQAAGGGKVTGLVLRGRRDAEGWERGVPVFRPRTADGEARAKGVRAGAGGSVRVVLFALKSVASRSRLQASDGSCKTATVAERGML